jgi:hypothetical protein
MSSCSESKSKLSMTHYPRLARLMNSLQPWDMLNSLIIFLIFYYQNVFDDHYKINYDKKKSWTIVSLHHYCVVRMDKVLSLMYVYA